MDRVPRDAALAVGGPPHCADRGLAGRRVEEENKLTWSGGDGGSLSADVVAGGENLAAVCGSSSAAAR